MDWFGDCSICRCVITVWFGGWLALLVLLIVVYGCRVADVDRLWVVCVDCLLGWGLVFCGLLGWWDCWIWWFSRGVRCWFSDL